VGRNSNPKSSHALSSFALPGAFLAVEDMYNRVVEAAFGGVAGDVSPVITI
jgi:hypothetical protein